VPYRCCILTPTLSVEAFQDKLVEESVVPAAVNAVESKEQCYPLLQKQNQHLLHKRL
jgi:hypothetical protein